jgi:nucleoside-diphosphate-sugar epimerase
MGQSVGDMTKRVAIIFGASGFLGSHLRGKLRKLNNPYLSVSRHKIEHEPSPSLSFDFPALEDFAKAYPAPRDFVVFNLVGSGRESLSRPLFETNFELANRIISFSKSIRAKKIVHVGGFGIPYGSQLSSESYYFSKGAAINSIIRSGLSAVVLNPSYIVGRGDALEEAIRSSVAKGSFAVPSLEPLYIQPIFIDDFVNVLFSAMDLPDGLAVIDVLGEKIELGDFFSRVFKRLSQSVRIERVPLETALRSALFEPNAAFGVSDLCILASNRLGEHTGNVLGVRIRPVNELLACL